MTAGSTVSVTESRISPGRTVIISGVEEMMGCRECESFVGIDVTEVERTVGPGEHAIV